jgi:hypothetical protein
MPLDQVAGGGLGGGRGDGFGDGRDRLRDGVAQARCVLQGLLPERGEALGVDQGRQLRPRRGIELRQQPAGCGGIGRGQQRGRGVSPGVLGMLVRC